jgi:hypothetical protein
MLCVAMLLFLLYGNRYFSNIHLVYVVLLESIHLYRYLFSILCVWYESFCVVFLMSSICYIEHVLDLE